jgi:Uma2 family endonuclease
MVQTPTQKDTITLELPSAMASPTREGIVLYVTHEQFTALAAANRDLRLERTAQGELIVNPSTGWETGKRNSRITGDLYLWWRSAGEPGKVFDSSTGFTLPNGAIRSPDASWISGERWEALTPEQKQTFANVCPDFGDGLFFIWIRANSRSPLQLKHR